MITTAADDLADGVCLPCRTGTAPVSPGERDALLRQVPCWTLAADGRSIGRRYGFRDFAAAFGFVSRIAALAEAQNHHPDLCLGWGYVSATLQTHAIDGLHRNDFIMAAQIERAFDAITGDGS